MKGWIGFGRESTPGPVATTAFFVPFVGAGQESCEQCGAIRSRDDLTFVGSTPDGDPLYLCAPNCNGWLVIAPAERVPGLYNARASAHDGQFEWLNDLTIGQVRDVAAKRRLQVVAGVRV